MLSKIKKVLFTILLIITINVFCIVNKVNAYEESFENLDENKLDIEENKTEIINNFENTETVQELEENNLENQKQEESLEQNNSDIISIENENIINNASENNTSIDNNEQKDYEKEQLNSNELDEDSKEIKKEENVKSNNDENIESDTINKDEKIDEQEKIDNEENNQENSQNIESEKETNNNLKSAEENNENNNGSIKEKSSSVNLKKSINLEENSNLSEEELEDLSEDNEQIQERSYSIDDEAEYYCYINNYNSISNILTSPQYIEFEVKSSFEKWYLYISNRTTGEYNNYTNTDFETNIVRIYLNAGDNYISVYASDDNNYASDDLYIKVFSSENDVEQYNNIKQMFQNLTEIQYNKIPTKEEAISILNNKLAEFNSSIIDIGYYITRYENETQEIQIYGEPIININGNEYKFSIYAILKGSSEEKLSFVTDENGDTYCYFYGNIKLVGIFARLDGENTYCFDENGKMIKNNWYLYPDGSETYPQLFYLDSNGKALKGIQIIDGKTYYFDDYYGIAYNGEHIVDGESYYFFKGEIIRNEWDSYKTHYIGPDGKSVKGFQVIDGYTYYFDESYGFKQTNFTAPDGRYFDSEGHLCIGWREQSWNWTETDENGNEVTYTYNEKYYYDENGYPLSGFQTIDGESYYFLENGLLATNYNLIDGRQTDSEGRIITGLYVEEGSYVTEDENGNQIEVTYTNKRLFDENGYPKSGIYVIDGETYYFDDTGWMEFDYWLDDGRYFNGDGKLAIGLCERINHIEYFNENGELIQEDIEEMYLFDDKGYPISGVHKIGGDTYYFDDNGKMLINSWDNHAERYFGEDGKMVTGPYVFTASYYEIDENGNEIEVPYEYTIEFDENGFANKFTWSDDGKHCYDEYGNMLKGFNIVYGKLYYFGMDSGVLKKTGWYNLDDNRYYFDPETGEVYTGIREVNGKYYLFDETENGRMQKGFAWYNRNLYYLGIATGVLKKSGWTVMDDIKYYINPETGIVARGIKEIDGKKYFFNEVNGQMEKGIINYRGYIYYFGIGTGVQKSSGWHNVDGKKYYFEYGTGRARTGWWYIDDNQYFFDYETGCMKTGFQQIDGNLYYFGKTSGKLIRTGWYTIDGEKYYLDEMSGIVKTGLVEINGKTYLFDPEQNGKMQKGFARYDGKLYYLGSATGELKRTGWNTINGNKYYFDTITGEVKVGMQEIDGEMYYFDENGVAQSGFITYEGNLYYFGQNSKKMIKAGWYQIGNNKYYMNPETGIVATGLVEIDGTVYRFGKKGVNY